MTLRSVGLGLLFVAALGVLIPYSDLELRGTWIGLTAFPIASLFVLILLVALVNPILRLRGLGLERGELLLIYCMTSAAAGIASFGLTGLLIPYLAGPSYFATPENRYDELIVSRFPSWTLPGNREAVVALYEGLSEGQPIPWGEWAVPLAVWSGFAISVYLVFFSLSALVARPWIEGERLVFPLVQVPLALTRKDSEDASLFPPILRSRVLWLFFLVPFLIHTVNGLHYHFREIPYINVHRIPLDQHFVGRPWNALSPFWLRISFSVIGLSYLLPAQLSFSLWFFYFFFLLQQVVGSWLGMEMPQVQAYPVRAFVGEQMFGGLLLFGVALVAPLLRQWRPRRSLAGVSEGHPLPKWPLCAGALGLSGACVFGHLVGAGFFKTLVLFSLYFLVHLVAVRLVCQGGMLYVQHPFRPLNMMLAAVGTGGIGPGALPPLALFDHLWMLDNRSPLMPEIMHGLRIGRDARIRPGPMMFALMASILVAMFCSYVSFLYLMYRHGGLVLNSWFTSYYSNNLFGRWTNHLIVNGEPPTPTTWLNVGAGAGTMALLLLMHWNFHTWPFHPIGYLMGASWPMINFWFSIFLGWLLKAGILRYGGGRVYRKLLPGFLGLIFAEFFSGGLWAIIDLFTGVRGHEIFSF